MDALAPYSKMNQQIQETLIKNNALLVKKIAYHLLGRLPQSVQVDDLIQVGMMGLLEATKNYDVSKGASFETYASIRIRGFMLDEVRKNDWVPRSVHRNSKIISQAIRQVEHQLGREAKLAEVASAMGISLSEYHTMLQESVSSHLYGFEDLGVHDDDLQDENKINKEPQQEVLYNDLLKRVSEVIKGLPKNEQMVLSLYYEHDLNLKEIGDILQVSESRICQILSQGIHRAKSRLSDY